MLRFVNIMLLVMMCTMIIILYQLKYESKLLSEKETKLVQQIQDERDNISVLKAEWSLLIGPDRIEPLAQRHLGLQSIQPGQFVGKEWLRAINKNNTPANLQNQNAAGR